MKETCTRTCSADQDGDVTLQHGNNICRASQIARSKFCSVQDLQHECLEKILHTSAKP